ncbi:MAG: hypothetical protein WAW06_04800 [bacterium]
MRVAQVLSVALMVAAAPVLATETVNFDDYVFSGSLSYAAADRYRSAGIVFGRDIPVENVQLFEPQSYSLFLSWGGTAPNALCMTQSTGLTMQAWFYLPGTTTPATTSLVRMLVMDTEVGSTLGVLLAYDEGHNLIDSNARLTPSSMGGYLEIDAPGIAEIYFYTDADGATFDNLTFTTPTGPSATDETTWGSVKALYR